MHDCVGCDAAATVPGQYTDSLIGYGGNLSRKIMCHSSGNAVDEPYVAVV